MNDINAKSNTYPFVEVVLHSEIVRSICRVNQSRFSRQNANTNRSFARDVIRLRRSYKVDSKPRVSNSRPTRNYWLLLGNAPVFATQVSVLTKCNYLPYNHKN